MTVRCDLVTLRSADGPSQMAADEALLAHAAAGQPALRFYTWSEPTLSLGYFQRAADRLTDRRLADLPFVRRPTGGGAIVHHLELTYGLAIPVGLSPRDGTNCVCRMHDAIRAALAELGVATALIGCGRESGRGRFLCFEHLTPGDVVIGGAKVVGSASRKRAGAVLHHGSILLAASPHAPHLPGVHELAGVDIEATELAQVLAGTFTQVFGWELAPGDWAALRTIQAGAERRYRDAGWNEKR
jgi:lipoyl(octanoyl) transferase